MDNRSKILQCALGLFSARGYEGIGVQEIADAAGITKPTLYHYFGSKAGLLSELLQDFSGRLCSELKTAAEYRRGDLTGTLDRVAEVYFRFARSNPRQYRMQLAHFFAPPEGETVKIAARFGEAQYVIIEQLFLEAGKEHGNMQGRQRLHAAAFIGMVNNYITIAWQGRLTLDDAFRRQVLHHFMHGIFS